MYQLHLGIGEDLERDLRAFAAANDGMSIASATRLLLRLGLQYGKVGELLKENRNAHASDR